MELDFVRSFISDQRLSLDNKSRIWQQKEVYDKIFFYVYSFGSMPIFGGLTGASRLGGKLASRIAGPTDSSKR
jgi:hypothetical protein